MKFLALASLVGLVAASPLAQQARGSAHLAPLYTPPSTAQDGAVGVQSVDESHIIPNSYIVVLHKDTHAAVHDQHIREIDILHEASTRLRRFGDAIHHAVADLTGLTHRYSIGSMKAYAGKFSEDVLEHIRSRPEVAYVERDSVVWATETERSAPWGLARISHRKGLSFGTFNRYDYESSGGEGVTAYIIDTGINIKHVEFEGRAKWGKTIPLNDQDVDANGHGTHVAGTIGSRKYGVAKAAQLIAVKVLGSNGSGTMSDVVGGVAWAADHAEQAAAAAAKAGSKSSHKGSVANMSLGGGRSVALDEAVNNAVDGGLHFAVAAGNDNRDACTFSPASAANPITVGASAISDARAYFSNHGKCVDVFAPGLNILSTWNTGNTSTNTISGTSMASPHVCGLAAYFLSLYPTAFTPTAEDYVNAGEFETSPYAEVNANTFGRRSQHVFGKLAEWVGFAPVQSKSLESLFKDKALSPKVLKQAVIRVATKGILTDLPAQTVNALIFNNYTVSNVQAAELGWVKVGLKK